MLMYTKKQVLILICAMLCSYVLFSFVGIYANKIGFIDDNSYATKIVVVLGFMSFILFIYFVFVAIISYLFWAVYITNPNYWKRQSIDIFYLFVWKNSSE